MSIRRITRVVSVERMRTLEQRAFSELHIDPLVLMETAGRAVADAVMASSPHRVHVVCGKGNNGGDGFVCARALAERGVAVSVSVIGGPLSAQAMVQRHWYLESGLLMRDDLALSCAEADVVVDALLGTGARLPLAGDFLAAVETMNAHAREVVAVDVPSGIGAEPSVRATQVVTFHARKREALTARGEVLVAPIGIPESYFTSEDGVWIEEGFARAHYSSKTDQANTHKGTFGHAAIVGGGAGKGGALCLATLGAFHVGVGLVTAVSLDPQSVRDLPAEVMTADAAPHKCTAIGIGPGLGQDATARRHYDAALAAQKPTVVDADGLALFAADGAHGAVPRAAPLVLTPHPLEFTRVFGGTVEALQNDRIDRARAAARACGAVVVLKGERTIVAAPSGEWAVNSTGDRALAKGGTGDVLCGVITGLLAQKYSPFVAACLGVYFHGLAGTRAGEQGSPASVMASDVAAALPFVMRDR